MMFVIIDTQIDHVKIIFHAKSESNSEFSYTSNAFNHT